MSTAINTTPQGMLPVLKQEFTWLQKHERIVIVFLVLLAGTYGWHRWVDYASTQANLRATVAEKALESAKATAAQNAAQSAQVEAQYQAMVDSLSKQNASLENAIAARSSALVTQKGTDAQLPPEGLANRILALSQAPPGSVSSTVTGVTLTTPGAVAVTQTLEEVPVLTANLNDTKEIEANEAKELTQANALVSTLGVQIAGLQAENQAGAAACTAQVNKLKADARKSKIRLFAIGVGAGALMVIHFVI